MGMLATLALSCKSKCIDRELKKRIQKVKAENENVQTLAWDLSKALNDGLKLTTEATGTLLPPKIVPQERRQRRELLRKRPAHKLRVLGTG